MPRRLITIITVVAVVILVLIAVTLLTFDSRPAAIVTTVPAKAATVRDRDGLTADMRECRRRADEIVTLALTQSATYAQYTAATDEVNIRRDVPACARLITADNTTVKNLVLGDVAPLMVSRALQWAVAATPTKA